MKQNIVTFNGVNYPVVFDLQALTNFEDITKQGFFEANLNMTNNRMAIVIASVLSADKDTKLTIEEMRGKGSFDDYKQIVEAYNVVMTFTSLLEMAKARAIGIKQKTNFDKIVVTKGETFDKGAKKEEA